MDHFAEYPSLPSSTHAINRAVVVTATLHFFLVGEGDKQDGGAVLHIYTDQSSHRVLLPHIQN